MPTTYFSPGVYVEEVSSGSAPIAGVGTSTAGFIGVIGTTPPAQSTTLPPQGTTPPPQGTTPPAQGTTPPPQGTYTLGKTEREKVGIGDGQKTVFDLNQHPASTLRGTFKVNVNKENSTDATITYDETNTKSQVKFTNAPAKDAIITVDYELILYRRRK